ncbi:MAG: alanine racemase, partial [Acidobacteriota bacterium]
MTHDRRSFLALAAGAALARSRPAAAQAPSAAPRRSAFDPWLEVRPDHLRHNVAEVSRFAANRPVLAVIKNNGYGLGVIEVARALEPAGSVAGFAVVKTAEAHALREAGIRKPVLLMGPVAESEVADLHRREISPMVYTPL